MLNGDGDKNSNKKKLYHTLLYISLLLFCMTTTKVKRLFIDSKANETFPLKFPECFSLI